MSSNKPLKNTPYNAAWSQPHSVAKMQKSKAYWETELFPRLSDKLAASLFT